MIPQAHITAWRSEAPWADDAQVEQDLVLSRAVVELFSDSALEGKIALRGATALNKLYFRPASRYSDDVDLVQTEAGRISPILDAIRTRLDAWLGEPQRSRATSSVTLTYRFHSEVPPVRPQRLKLEINTREHFTVLGYERKPLAVTNPWFTGVAGVNTYGIDELLATKLRALFQRKKGRDLFDLWLCIERGMLDPDEVITCFARYMEHEGRTITRAEFERNLYEKASDPAFTKDIAPLLVTGVDYDGGLAVRRVHEVLIRRLPGEPWRGRG